MKYLTKLKDIYIWKRKMLSFLEYVYLALLLRSSWWSLWLCIGGVLFYSIGPISGFMPIPWRFCCCGSEVKFVIFPILLQSWSNLQDCLICSESFVLPCEFKNSFSISVKYRILVITFDPSTAFSDEMFLTVLIFLTHEYGKSFQFWVSSV